MCKMCGIMMRNNIQIWLIRLFDNVAKSSCKSLFMARFIGKIVQFCRVGFGSIGWGFCAIWAAFMGEMERKIVDTAALDADLRIFYQITMPLS